MQLPVTLQCMSKHIQDYQKSQEFGDVINNAI